MLSLPLNREDFESLIKRDPHPAFTNLYTRFELKSKRIYNKLVRILSALAYWCPLFAEVKYLPELVYPFVQLIKNDDLVLYEVLVSFLMQHCQLWFEHFPSDPVHILKTSVEVLIKKESPQLYQHFDELGFGVAQYSWPLISNMFSTVLPKDDWVKLMDNLITHHNKPELMYYFNAAYLLSFKGTLLKISSIEEMHEFIQTQNPANMKLILKHMYKLHSKYENNDNVYIGICGNYLPLPSTGAYPVFNNYPVENVAYSQHIRAEKLSFDNALDKKEVELNELRGRVTKLLIQDKHKRDQAEAISQNMNTKSQLEHHDLELQILNKMKTHDERTEFLKQMEQTLKLALEDQEKQRLIEKQRMSSEYDQRRKLQAYQHKTYLQEEAIRNMEHQATQRVLEMLSIREKEDHSKQLNIEAELRLKEEQARDQMLMEKWKLEDDERKLKTELLLREKQQERELQVHEHDKRQIEMQHRLHQLEKDVYVAQLERERKMRQTEEEYIYNMHKMQAELKKKNELLRQEEERQARLIIEQEKQLMRDEKFDHIQREKEEIEKALEYERQEQDRLMRLAEKKRFEEELMNIKLGQQARQREEARQISHINDMILDEKKQREQMNNELFYREKEIAEKQQFYELLSSTEDNIRKLEIEKHEKANADLRKSVEQAVYKSKEERENKLREIVRDREINFQEFALKRQEQISQEYQNIYATQKSNIENSYDASIDNENLSPNKMYKSNSDLSNSMNQKYINKDKYTSKDTNSQNKSRGVLSQSYPASNSGHGSAIQIKSNDSLSEMSEDSFVSHRDKEDDEALHKHEQTKQAFENYKKSTLNDKNVIKSFDYSRESGYDYNNQIINSVSELPVKDSTFGAYRVSQEYIHNGMDNTMFSRMENQEVRSQFAAKASRFSNFSSPITEESEGESSLTCSENNMSMASRQSENYEYLNQMHKGYMNNYEAPNPTKAHLNYMYSQSPGNRSSHMNDTSELSETSMSEDGMQDRSKYHHGIQEMPVNPFYKPNHVPIKAWRKVE